MSLDETRVSKRCWVLGVGKPYSFPKENTNEIIEGCKMFYAGTDDLYRPVVEDQNGTIGYFPQEYTMPVDFQDSVRRAGIVLPCQADIEFSLVFSPSGVKSAIRDVKFINADKPDDKGKVNK